MEDKSLVINDIINKAYQPPEPNVDDIFGIQPKQNVNPQEQPNSDISEILQKATELNTYQPTQQTRTPIQGFFPEKPVTNTLTNSSYKPITRREAGLSTALSLASQMGSSSNRHRTEMENYGKGALAIESNIYKAYARVGMPVPDSVREKIEQYRQTELQQDRVASMDSNALGLVGNSALNPIEITNRANKLQSELMQMTSPVLNYEDRLNMIIKENSVASSNLAIYQQQLEFIDSEEAKRAQRVTANLDDETLREAVNNASLRESLGLSYEDVANANLVRITERIKTEDELMKNQKEYEARQVSQIIDNMSMEELINLSNGLSNDGFAEVDGVYIDGSADTMKALMSVIKGREEANAKGQEYKSSFYGYFMENTSLGELREAADYSLDEAKRQEANEYLNLINGMVQHSNLLKSDLPAEVVEFRNLMAQINATPNGYSFFNQNMVNEAYIKARNAIRTTLENDYKNDKNPFNRMAIEQLMNKGDIDYQTAQNIISNKDYDVNALFDGIHGEAFKSAIEELQEISEGKNLTGVNPTFLGQMGRRINPRKEALNPEKGIQYSNVTFNEDGTVKEVVNSNFFPNLSVKDRDKVVAKFYEKFLTLNTRKGYEQGFQSYVDTLPEIMIDEQGNEITKQVFTDQYLKPVFNKMFDTDGLKADQMFKSMYEIDGLTMKHTNGNLKEPLENYIIRNSLDVINNERTTSSFNLEQLAFLKTLAYGKSPESKGYTKGIYGFINMMNYEGFEAYYFSNKGLFSGKDYEARFVKTYTTMPFKPGVMGGQSVQDILNSNNGYINELKNNDINNYLSPVNTEQFRIKYGDKVSRLYTSAPTVASAHNNKGRNQPNLEGDFASSYSE